MVTPTTHSIRGGPPATPSPQMGRYRAYSAYYERYWSRLFGVTQADLDLAAEMIPGQPPGQACDLTTIVRAVIAARLSRGPRLNSTPAPDNKAADPLVRQWDPEASWSVGDRGIFVVPDLDRVRGFAPWLGEIVQAGGDHVLARIDGRAAPEVCALGPVARSRVGISAQARMAALAQSDDPGSWVDEVVWRFGGVVVSRLLGALKADDRFLELEGLWFLRALCRRPRERDLVAAAAALFELRAPSATLDWLAASATPGGQFSAAERFGWALALEERPDMFALVSALPQSRWALAGPPPVSLTARNAAYDPETYEVVCTPGDPLPPTVAKRLWNSGLLYAALGGQRFSPGPQDVDVAQGPLPAAAGDSPPVRPRRVWWRRLSLSRRRS
jgi:hypothetical protein